MPQFGTRRIYYNNFAEHLLNRFNPNMTYPDKMYRWTEDDWRGVMDMVADCGFNVFEFWLVPRLFCREALSGDYLEGFLRQIRAAAEQAHKRGMKVEVLCSLATVGSDWLTLCPNCPEEWREIRFLWEKWTKLLDFVDIFGIFPGDPGACSRNGCTALTYIDKSIEISHLIHSLNPNAEIEFGTWGPPFFGWGIIQGPAGWKGEFVQSYQSTAWVFDEARMKESMDYLVKRASDFPQPVSFAVNMGFNPDCIAEGANDGRAWARKLAEKYSVQTWDFSLTEGENGIFPHYRFERLFKQRKRELESKAYSGGICFTMTPLLNVLSLYESAHSFMEPEGDPDRIAREFYEKAFGAGAGELAADLVLFEVIPEWGNHTKIEISRKEYHERMTRLAERAASWKGRLNGSIRIWPSAEFHRAELEFFAGIFRDLSAEDPDYETLAQKYWDHVYKIYDDLPAHVDPRPKYATNNLVDFFRKWERTTADSGKKQILGKWA